MRVGLEVIKCVVRGYDWTGSSYHKCEYDNNEATLVALYTLFVGDNDLNNTQKSRVNTFNLSSNLK